MVRRSRLRSRRPGSGTCGTSSCRQRRQVTRIRRGCSPSRRAAGQRFCSMPSRAGGWIARSARRAGKQLSLGLDQPIITLTLHTRRDGEHTLLVGAKTADESTYYVLRERKGDVVLVPRFDVEDVIEDGRPAGEREARDADGRVRPGCAGEWPPPMVPPSRRGGRTQHVAPLRLNPYQSQSAGRVGVWTPAKAGVTNWGPGKSYAAECLW